jgi:subtilisin-like proprotein convertase family protein
MKPFTKRFLPLLLLAGLSTIAQAAVVFNWTGSQIIPDHDASGVAFSFNLSDPATSITDIAVTLDIAGGFNGDLYAYLSHGDGFAVLLNRVGRTAVNELGYSNPGFAVTLSGSAPVDLHLYQANSPFYNGNNQLTGLWAADGRDVDPGSSRAALDGAARDATLSIFHGLNPNGDWTLFFADVSAGGISTLNSLSVEITAVPEPKQTVVVVTIVLVGLGLFRKLHILSKLAKSGGA